MKIYTKTGDKGTTSLIGGKRVAKYHPRIEAYGTVDELIAFIGLLRDQQVSSDTRDMLIFIQDRLMNCASILAADCEDCKVRIPLIEDADISKIEESIDAMDAQLEPLTSFVLPGGHPIVSLCHVCRTVCRRAERLATKLAEEIPVPDNLIIFLNRLSDYFFTLSRKLGQELNVKQIKWEPNLK
ncbi:MAG: cob(I)yrinic acid a,c-diamide adenosyltransferase [Bacteroidales bacterium]|nr:cob(I)yrinic acid a,c-diamide adenosyltransferase [Bacteroidales bacterium]HPD95258.1 cob(I)yrinic acid a,c-diamide adenosyltransferase [Tenuifilaceae bacterium]HRX31455.1 cob(I)yrinic acid a,c-diamide adenosyltransferase [Tenuifilaceae bacterium]